MAVWMLVPHVSLERIRPSKRVVANRTREFFTIVSSLPLPVTEIRLFATAQAMHTAIIVGPE
jgi:hypothetical protein